jgi:hypothetical protein
MKILVLGFAAGLALAFASDSPASAQTSVPSETTVPYAGTYFETVASQNCVGDGLGNTSCTFTFKEVPTVPSVNGSGTAVLMVSRVSCRIVVAGDTSLNGVSSLGYAALSKSSNAQKVFFLSSYANPMRLNTAPGTGPFSVFSIDEATQLYVGPTVSPTITIATSLPVAAPHPSLDQPTCSISGLIQ